MIQTNKPFNWHQIEKLSYGYTPSGIYPNRKNRRLIKQKRTHRPNMSMVSYFQYILVNNSKNGKLNLSIKRITHYKKTIGYN